MPKTLMPLNMQHKSMGGEKLEGRPEGNHLNIYGVISRVT
jgi:hypothetical protein